MSSAAAVTLRLTMPRHPSARAQPSTSRLTPSIPSAAGTEPLVFVFSLTCDRFDQDMYHFDA